MATAASSREEHAATRRIDASRAIQSRIITVANADAILGQDPASVAIRTSLENHRRILVSTASYAMLDPYAPSVEINQRKTDTLFALGKAWATLSH